MSTVISVEHLSKAYRLGQIGTGTFSNDLKVWWARLRGQTNPLLRIGEKDQRDDLWALHDVSFKVEQGDLLGIIGRNGAGKSTLLKILSRVTAPTAGKVKVKGRIASLLEVGTGFHPDLTGRENIFLNGAILGMTKAEIRRRFDEIVDFSGVEQFIDTPVKRYSSGMYVRMAFAVAAHLDPDILIVDEVLAVGDAAFQKKCLGKMQDVSQHGRTVLFVSHNMDAMESLTKSCLWLGDGRILGYAPTPEMVAAYLSAATREGTSSDGFHDLTTVERHADLRGAETMRFCWIRTCDENDQPVSVFSEGAPIRVQVGFEIKDQAPALRIGCSVNYDRFGRSLFTVASDTLALQGVGRYETAFTISPNYLRSGSYTLDLKAFLNDTRCDHVAAIRFSIIDNPANRVSVIEPWIAGPLAFDYRWGDLAKEGSHVVGE